MAGKAMKPRTLERLKGRARIDEIDGKIEKIRRLEMGESDKAKRSAHRAKRAELEYERGQLAKRQ